MHLSHYTEAKQTTYTDQFTLVWIHGFGFDNSIWKAYKPLAKEHCFITLPGHEKPTHSNFETPLYLDRYAQKLATKLQALKLKNPILIGHSMGGYIALELLKYFDIKGLVLFHSHPFKDSKEIREKRQRVIQWAAKNCISNLINPMIQSLFAEPQTHKAIIKIYQDTAKTLSIKTFQQGHFAMMNRNDNTSTLASYPNPVLFINGQKDIAVSRDYQRKQVTLPTISKVCNLTTGHMGMFENEAATMAELKQFINLCQIIHT